jgi:hypothetical protein
MAIPWHRVKREDPSAPSCPTSPSPPLPAQVASLSLAAQAELILDEAADPVVVLRYTGQLVERVEGLRVGGRGRGREGKRAVSARRRPDQ